MTWREKIYYFFVRFFGWTPEKPVGVGTREPVPPRGNSDSDVSVATPQDGADISTDVPSRFSDPFSQEEPVQDPKDLTADQVKSEIERLGYELFEGKHNPNLFGIRILEDADEWNDWIGCLFQDEEGTWQMDMYQGTTDPGIPWLVDPSREEGCAVLATGQHRGCWVFGYHRGKYRALIQHGNKVSVWRDNNLDSKIDVGSHDPIPGFYGINLHRASAHRLVDSVQYYSAGCCVIRDPGDYSALLDFLDSTQDDWGDRFSFTLLSWPFGEDNAKT